MAKSVLDPIDANSYAPLLAMLPTLGRVADIERYYAAFFARHDKVQALLSTIDPNNDGETFRRIRTEEQMLKAVLDWMAVWQGGES